MGQPKSRVDEISAVAELYLGTKEAGASPGVSVGTTATQTALKTSAGWPSGRLAHMTGIDNPCEPPTSAALVIAGATGGVAQAVRASCRRSA